MNIVWISYYPLEATEHPAPWVITLAKEIVQAGHKLTILTVTSKIDKVKRTTSPNGYELIVIPYKGGIVHLLGLFNTRINSLRDFLNSYQEPIDVIHIHGTEHQFVSSLLRTRNKIPFIISVQGIMSLYKGELRKKLSPVYLFWSISSYYEKKEIRFSNYFFCRTHWDQGFIKKINNGAQIFLNWEAIRPEFFNYHHNFNGQDILFMGGMSFLKALNICLQTFDALLSQIQVKLHIVGSCSKVQIQEIKEKYSLHNISEENIILHGKLEAEQICTVYQKCFCLYHPSLIDNSPNSVCEAQVAGLPVVATNVGGVSSLIVDGQTGVLVTKNDVSQHTNILLNLYNQDAFKRKLSSTALQIARKRHDKNVIINKTIDTYKRLAKPAV